MSKECVDCHISINELHFTSKRCKSCAETKLHACERERRGVSKRGDAISCPVCQRKMYFITTGHITKHGFSNAKEFKEHFGLSSLKSDSISRRQSEFMANNNPTKGRARTSKELALMSENRAGKGIGRTGKYIRTKEIREKISIGMSRAVSEGRSGGCGSGGRGYSGTFITSTFDKCSRDPITLRSTWEARVADILDASDQIISFRYEAVSIPYEWEGSCRRYIPDFLVETEGGIRELWEIKPANQLKLARNQAKVKALNKYAAENNMNVRLVSLKDILAMEEFTGTVNRWS